MNSQLREFFKTTVGVRQGCLLSPILFNLVVEKITQGTAMTNTYSSPSVEGQYAPYDLPTTSILRAAAMANFKKDLTNGLVDSSGIWNGSQQRKEQDHDQQNEQHQCRYQHERPEVRGDDQFQIPRSKTVQRWHLLSRSPHQNCLNKQ